MSRSTIFGLAFIQVNWDELGQDYVENFVPLIAECLRRSDTTVVSLPDLQTKIKDFFGLELPQNAIRVILQRAAKKKYVELKNHVFYVNKENCEALNFQATQERVTAIHSRVTTKLKGYISREHHHEWTVEQTEKAIHDFLRDNSVSLIFSLAENSSLLDRSHAFIPDSVPSGIIFGGDQIERPIVPPGFRNTCPGQSIGERAVFPISRSNLEEISGYKSISRYFHYCLRCTPSAPMGQI